jgi:hypothetical protein
MDPETAQVAARLVDGVLPRVQRRLEDLVGELGDRLTAEAWRSAVSHAQHRAGLWVSGDFGAAAEALLAGAPREVSARCGAGAAGVGATARPRPLRHLRRVPPAALVTRPRHPTSATPLSRWSPQRPPDSRPPYRVEISCDCGSFAFTPERLTPAPRRWHARRSQPVASVGCLHPLSGNARPPSAPRCRGGVRRKGWPSVSAGARRTARWPRKERW